jgi:hypothetical protein
MINKVSRPMPDLPEWRFRDWLRMQSPVTCVGYALHGESCPLANWLSEEVLEGVTEIFVTEDQIDVRHGEDDFYTTYRPHAWMQTFIERVDDIGKERDDSERDITAGMALELLADIHVWELAVAA